jgi:hypothetical protein
VSRKRKKRAARGNNTGVASDIVGKRSAATVVRRIQERAPHRLLTRVLTVLGWLVSALAVVSCAAVWWVCARLELLFTAAGVRELAGLGVDGARERLASVQLEALTPFVALYGWRYVAVAVILSAGFGVGFALLWLGRAR